MEPNLTDEDLAAIDVAIQEGFLAPYEEPLTPTRDRIIDALKRHGFRIVRIEGDDK